MEKLFERQQKMLESNQKLMMQLMSTMVGQNNNQACKVPFADGPRGGGATSSSSDRPGRPSPVGGGAVLPSRGRGEARGAWYDEL